MEMYYVKKFFEKVCDAHYIAYEKLTRLKKEAKKLDEDPAERRLRWKEHLESTAFWNKKLIECRTEVFDIMQEVHREGGKLLITTSEEVLVLIYYFAAGSIKEGYPILNVEEGFPTDDTSQKFLEAYKTNNISMMYELYADTFGKDID